MHLQLWPKALYVAFPVRPVCLIARGAGLGYIPLKKGSPCQSPDFFQFPSYAVFCTLFAPRSITAQKKATANAVTYCFVWSEREDLNLRPLEPHSI